MKREKQYCPICGARIHGYHHTCRQNVLNAIDAAHRRNPDEEEPKAVPFGQRLAIGFMMLEEGEDQYAL